MANPDSQCIRPEPGRGRRIYTVAEDERASSYSCPARTTCG